jgi:tetratricopeptide (TPR) repeat protein
MKVLMLFLVVWTSATSAPAQATVIISGVMSRYPAAIEKPSVRRYWEGVDALARSDFKSAEAAFHDSLRMDPTWHGPFLGLADAAVRDGRPQDAAAWLGRAEAMAPRSVEVLTARGHFHFLQGEPEKAEGAYEKAISVDEQAFLPRLGLADLYLHSLWKPVEAVDAYRGVLKMNSEHAGGHYGLGVALMATGAQDEAITELNTSIALAPENPLPHVALGRLYSSLGAYGKAVAAFDDALEVQPDFAIVHVERGDAFAANGEIDAAIADYQAAVEAAPKLSHVHFKLGSIYQHLQRWDDAESAFLNAIESDPRNVRALNNLAWLVVERQKRLDDALAWATQAVELAPDMVAFQDTLGWVWRARGDLGKAAEVLERAAAADPHLADISYHLGIVYSEQGRKSAAVAAFKKALDIDRDFAQAADVKSRIAALSGG